MTGPTVKAIADIIRDTQKVIVQREGDRRATDYRATLLARKAAMMALANILDPPLNKALANLLDPPLDIDPGIPSDTLAEKETGPENSREEVVGTTTRGSGSGYSNSGFGGGEPSEHIIVAGSTFTWPHPKEDVADGDGGSASIGDPGSEGLSCEEYGGIENGDGGSAGIWPLGIYLGTMVQWPTFPLGSLLDEKRVPGSFHFKDWGEYRIHANGY